MSLNFASCLSHRGQSGKQKLVSQQQAKASTVQSPFKQTIAKASAVYQKKMTPSSQMRQKYVQMMNSTTQSTFVRSNGAGSGTMHSSGKDLLAKQVQLPQISKHDSKKTFNRIRSEQRQAVNRHYANFTNTNHQAKRKNLSSQPKVLTIGQVLLEQQQQKRMPQLPTITPQGNLSGQLSRNKEFGGNHAVESGSQHIDTRKKSSQSGLQTSVMQRVSRDPRQKDNLTSAQYQFVSAGSTNHHPQHSNQGQAPSSAKQGVASQRPARIYTAKLASGTMKNFFFNNNPTSVGSTTGAIPGNTVNQQQHQGASNRSQMVQNSSKKLKTHQRAPTEKFQQYAMGGGSSNAQQRTQLVVISSQPEAINASASLEVDERNIHASNRKAREGRPPKMLIESPNKSASNSRQPSASGQTQITRASMLKIQQLQDEGRQPQSLDEALESTNKRPHHSRHDYIIHYSSSQTQLQQLGASQDFLFEPEQSLEQMREQGGGQTAGSYVQVRNTQQMNTGNPRRALYSAKQVSQVYRPQPIQQLQNKQHILSANKKKQSIQAVKQSAGNHFKLMQQTQQQFFSKKQVSVAAQVAPTTGRNPVSQRPSQPITSTNINSAPKTSTSGKHANGKFQKRTFVNQTASEIFVNHPTTSGSFYTGNQTPSTSAAFGGNGISTSHAKAGQRLVKDEVVKSQQNGSMVQLTSNSPKQATTRQRPANNAVTSTMTPDLSQKFILFKEQRKRASINNANEHTSAVKTSAEDQFSQVAKNNVMSNRVHSTLAHYNNQLNFDQPTASQSPQAAAACEHHMTTQTSDLNQMLLTNLIQRGEGGFSRENQVYEQSRSTSQMQYKTKPEHANPSSQLGISFKQPTHFDHQKENVSREASPEFSGLQRSETHDTRRKTGRKFIQQTHGQNYQQEIGKIQPRGSGGDAGGRKTLPEDCDKIRNEAMILSAAQSNAFNSRENHQVTQQQKYQERTSAVKYAMQQQQQFQSDKQQQQQVMKKRLVYSSYLRKSTQQDTVQNKQQQQQQRADQTKNATKAQQQQTRTNMRKR